jgi:hypothetical protein
MIGYPVRRLVTAVLTLILALCFAVPAQAASASADLTGSVTKDGVGVSHATVTLSGNQHVIRTTTDAHGRFSFNALAFGTYRLQASSAGISGELSIDLGSGGADVTLALTALKQIGSVKVVRANPVRGSGADVQLNATDLTRAPSSDSFPEALIQLPGTARGANGVVHMNGDHGVIDYVVDGVPIPRRSIARSAVKSIPTTSRISTRWRVRIPLNTAFGSDPF